MSDETERCPSCGGIMREYYVGCVPIGMFHTMERVVTYICEDCGRILFFAKDFIGKNKRDIKDKGKPLYT